jgi:Rieske Fe-S protein
MEDPYHYVRVVNQPRDGSDLLIVGGEDHKTGQDDKAPERFGRLEAWTRTRFPFAERVVERWSGQIMEPSDGVGFVGKNPGSNGSVFVITGDSGNGLTLGTLGAHIVTDLIEGRRNAWAEVFDPSRSMFHAASSFLRENANVAAQYVDLVSPGDVSSERQIERGEGAIVRDGARLLAVFNDAHGELHVCSALCPHLDGVVHWNSVEKSWDCPCHGTTDLESEVIHVTEGARVFAI